MVITGGLLAYANVPFLVIPDNGGATTLNGSYFSPREVLATQSTLKSITLADVDGDGKTDLIVTASASARVSIHRNTSTNTGVVSYAANVDFTTGNGPCSVTAADIDGDGLVDLAVTNQTSNTVSVLRNTSSGSGSINFAAKIDFVTATEPVFVTANDLDKDGKTDLAIANFSSNSISVLRNISTGVGSINFSTKADYTTGTNPYSVVIGDLDVDGKQDLTAANYGSNSISVLRNTTSSGILSFTAKTDFTTGSNPITLAVGDLDSDGKLDLAVTNRSSNSVSLFRNTSTGVGSINFAGRYDVAAASGPWFVAIGDLNGDAKPDLAVANQSAASASIIQNTSTLGNITFASKIDLTNTGSTYGVAIGDLDGDNEPDLVVPSYLGSSLNIFRNAQIPEITSITPSKAAVGASVTISGSNFDLGGNNTSVFFGTTKATITNVSRNSLIVTVPAGAATNQPVVVLSKGLMAYSSVPFTVIFNGTTNFDTNSFASKSDVTTGTTPYSIASGDVDGDGKIDLAVTNYGSNTVSVFRNNSSGVGNISYAAKIDLATNSNPYKVAMGDLNGDGKIDLAVANYNSGNISVFKNTSSGSISFAAKADLATSTVGPLAVAINDFDKDGMADLAAVSYNGSSTSRLSIFRNTGTPNVTTISFGSVLNFSLDFGATSIDVGDLNADGLPDVVATNSLNNSVSVVKNISPSIGLIDFATAQSLTTASLPYSVNIGDLDGDLKGDLVVSNQASNSLSIFRNTTTADGTNISFTNKVDFTVGRSPYRLCVADLNGDGKLDVASVSYTDATVSVLKNTSGAVGSVAFATRVDYTTGLQPYDVVISDLDGNSQADLIVANAGINTISTIRNNQKQSQTIAFSALAPKSIGDVPFSLTATATSGLPVNYSTSNPSVATIAGSTVTIVGAGSTIITASQLGDGTFSAATDVSQTLTVKANQTITFAALPTKTFGDESFNLTATTSSTLPISYASSNTSVATVLGNAIAIVGAGTTQITASQAGNDTYNAAIDVIQTLTVNKANQTITFATIATKLFGDAPFTLTATSSSNLPIIYTTDNNEIATISGNTVTILGAGNITIQASQPGNANFNSAPDVVQPLTISKANQTITFSALASKSIGDKSFNLTASSSSGLEINYTSSNTAVATVTGSTVNIIGSGSTTIAANQAGNSNFNAANEVKQTLNVRANQTILFASIDAKTFGDAPFVLAASASSGLAVSYTSSNPSVAIIAGNTVTIVGAGTATISAMQSGNSDFDAAQSIDQVLTVNKAEQVITFNALPDKTLGDGTFGLTATSTSNLAVSFNSTSDKVSLSGSQVTLAKAGRTVIKAAQVGNANYNPAVSIDQSFCIKPSKPTITLSNANSETPLLTSSASTGNQWYLAGAVISGATAPTLTATIAGIYKVNVTIDDCVSEFSDTQTLVVTGDLSTLNNSIVLYPNPVKNWLTVYSSSKSEKREISIHLLTGQQLSSQLIAEKEANVYVGDLPPGIYVLKFVSNDTRSNLKFVKE